MPFMPSSNNTNGNKYWLEETVGKNRESRKMFNRSLAMCKEDELATLGRSGKS